MSKYFGTQFQPGPLKPVNENLENYVCVNVFLKRNKNIIHI